MGEASNYVADDPDPLEIDILLESGPSGSGPLESSGSAPTPSSPLPTNGVFPAPGTPVPEPAPLPAEPAPLQPEVGMGHFPYTYHETVGGESLADTHRRYLLASASEATPLEWKLTLVNAQDSFEVKADIICKMQELDPEGGWRERGAKYLRNARTPTGEEPFARLVSLREQLRRGRS